MNRSVFLAAASAFLFATLALGAGGQNAAPNSTDKKAAHVGDAAKGKEVFEQCSVCHNSDSEEKKIGPGLKGLFKRDKLVNGKKVTDANVRDLINTGGNGMPAYSDMLSSDEKDDLLAFLKTL